MGASDVERQVAAARPEVAAYVERATAWSEAAAAVTRHVSDIAYGPAPRQTLDIYLPDNAGSGAGLPVLIFIHGGRWRMGKKEWNGFMAPPVIGLNAILVSPGYGLSPDHRFPTPLEDILAAAAWVHANIAAHGGDPDRLLIGGHSAGGHLAALAVTRRDLHPRYGLPEGVFKACLPMSGTMNFDFDEVLPGSEEEEIRGILLADEAQAPAASPLRHVKGTRTPFHLTWGEHDFPRVIATGKEMVAALEAEGCPCEWREVEGEGHFDVHLALKDAGDGWYRTVRQWTDVRSDNAHD